MVTIHNFKEENHHHQSVVIPYRLLQEQAAVMLGICSNSHPAVINSLEITD